MKLSVFTLLIPQGSGTEVSSYLKTGLQPLRAVRNVPILVTRRAFSSSTALSMSRRELLDTIDWDRQGGSLFVVVDPLDHEGLLYLSEKEYKDLVRIALSNDAMVEVLARPGSKRPVENTTGAQSKSSSFSPPLPRRTRLQRRFISSLGKMFPKFSEEDGMVSLYQGNLVKVVIRWASTLTF
jgi:hypothetical protein